MALIQKEIEHPRGHLLQILKPNKSELEYHDDEPYEIIEIEFENMQSGFTPYSLRQFALWLIQQSYHVEQFYDEFGNKRKSNNVKKPLKKKKK